MKKSTKRSGVKAKRATVFIVDDHPIVRRGLEQLINQEADLVVCGQAEGAQTALEAMKKWMPDVALVDLSLTGESGLELIKDIKVRYPKVAVLVLSMHDETFYAERVLRAGAKGYIMKRQAAAQIVAAIRRILSGEIWLSDPMAAKILRKVAGGKTEAVGSPIERLSNRELEVFQLIGIGLGTRHIAERISRSVKTVEAYREHIKVKLDLKDATELNQAAIQWLQSEHSK
ncbi:MAG: DNA-binding response regulator [Candidatus Omnitrophica bacterium CG11_big_fil_rev_8_21_14_0_20_64_10]|nr:MAG: DNA-binding response regulator [Candidatus Omnitrophica bacterium CG11_big_fil_rev_8_21_14_0_20_64_10]